MATTTNAERGTALVESCIVIMLTLSLVAGTMSGMYLGFARVWIRHASYEGAICLAKDETVLKCRNEIQNRINGVLIGNPISNLQLRKSKRTVEVTFDVKVAGTWRANESRKLKLPLHERRTFL